MYGAAFHCCTSCVVRPPNTPGMDPPGRDLLGFHPPAVDGPASHGLAVPAWLPTRLLAGHEFERRGGLREGGTVVEESWWSVREVERGISVAD